MMIDYMYSKAFRLERAFDSCRRLGISPEEERFANSTLFQKQPVVSLQSFTILSLVLIPLGRRLTLCEPPPHPSFSLSISHPPTSRDLSLLHLSSSSLTGFPREILTPIARRLARRPHPSTVGTRPHSVQPSRRGPTTTFGEYAALPTPVGFQPGIDDDL